MEGPAHVADHSPATAWDMSECAKKNERDVNRKGIQHDRGNIKERFTEPGYQQASPGNYLCGRKSVNDKKLNDRI
ncbi:hypothetical protein LJ707_02235 [Mucilaginibacter sp. UR6-1]|nr:hypothetical protein [Mucilaginibacter sp. UR6-1]MCC8407730.1 hypothetical protein [Mucilaginibacter sp. UR6-1]